MQSPLHVLPTNICNPLCIARVCLQSPVLPTYLCNPLCTAQHLCNLLCTAHVYFAIPFGTSRLYFAILFCTGRVYSATPVCAMLCSMPGQVGLFVELSMRTLVVAQIRFRVRLPAEVTLDRAYHSSNLSKSEKCPRMT